MRGLFFLCFWWNVYQSVPVPQPCCILSPGIFRTVSLFRTVKRWPGIFRTLCNACIRRNLAYSESWNIQNSFIIASQRIFRILSYLRKFSNIQNSDIFKIRHIFRKSQRFEMEFFAKIVKNYNYISKALHLRFLAVFWIRISLNKYSLRIHWRLLTLLKTSKKVYEVMFFDM